MPRPRKTTPSIVRKIRAVDKAFAVSATDLTAALARVGTAAVDAGDSMDELIGQVAAAKNVTARSGKVIGNALTTIFTRLGQPTTTLVLRSLGVATHTARGQRRQANAVLKDLAKVYPQLAATQQRVLLEAVGGVYHVTTLQALLADLRSPISVSRAATRAARKVT